MNVVEVGGYPYIQVDQLPTWVRWDTPRREQGQMMSHSFAGRSPQGNERKAASLDWWAGSETRSPSGPGDALMRITDENGADTYYRRPETWTVEAEGWVKRRGVHELRVTRRQATLAEVLSERDYLGRDEQGRHIAVVK